MYNSLWLTWRGVWRAVLLRSRARGASSSGAKSVYPDPKARSSPRRKSLRGTFARLSLRKHKRRQVLANLRLRSWTNLWLVPVCYFFSFRACALDRGELNLALDWFDGVGALLFEFSLLSTKQPLELISDAIQYLNLGCDWFNGGCVCLFDSRVPGLHKLHSYKPTESSFWLVQWRMRPCCKCTWMGQVCLIGSVDIFDTIFSVTQYCFSTW